MGRFGISSITILFLLLFNIACFRESTVEQAPTTTTQATEDNMASLATGTAATGQVGDFTLESATLQVVVNGGVEDLDRLWFLEKNAGSIHDLSTRFESSLNRQLFSRNDDGLSQLTQGVNMNRRTLVSYDSVTVNPVDRNIATLVLRGKIFDMDGSLAAAGAQVDSVSKAVMNCDVETVLEVRNDIPNPTDAENDFLVFYLSMTTVVRNTGDAPLPIYTVNDIVVTQTNAYSTFVPYPDWGYKRPDRQPGQHAYPPYLQLQPRQLNTAHYGFTSRVDGVLMADEEVVPDEHMNVLYVGKISQPNRTLAPGDAMTFVRECFALNGLSSSSETFLANEAAYGALIDLLQLAPMEEDVYNQTGNLTLNLVTNFDQDGMITVENIAGGLRYYNGSGYVPLEAGRAFPLFGSNPVFSNYSNIRLPVGDYRLMADLANGEPIFLDTIITTETDENGDPVTQENPLRISENETLSLTGVQVSQTEHTAVAMRVLDTNSRILFARGVLSTADGSNDVILGELPDHTQGRIIYVDSINSNSMFLPAGDFIISMSHGPRYGLNSPTTSVATRVVEGSDPERTTFGAIPSSFTFTLTEQVPLSGYFSADFDVRTDNDTAGLVNMRDMIRFAYSEDLDVFFAADTRNPSEVELEVQFVALGLGALDEADLAEDIDSFFDEVAVSRAIGTYGRSRQEPKKLGRFALFNLPAADAEKDFFAPGFEGDPAGFYDRVREANPDVVIQASRPRSPSGLEAGLFTAIAQRAGVPAGSPIPGDSSAYRTTAASGSETRWIDFDLLQVLAGNNYQEYLLARQDWFGLLNTGIFKPATGGSLPGEVKDIPLGAVRTYVAVSNTELRENDLAEFWEASKAGRSFVTNGPIIEASINGASYGETTTNGGTVSLNLKVSASDWIPVDEVRIIVDGVVQDIEVALDQDNIVRFDGQVQLDLEPGPHWIVIEAGAPLGTLTDGQNPGRQFWRSLPGHKPVAFTNPIFVQ